MIKSVVKLNKTIIKKQIFKFFSSAKILKMKKQPMDILSDEDIKNLFVGLLNLVKNNALKKAELIYKNEINYYQELLNLNLSKVVKLEKEVKSLKQKQLT